MTERRQGAPPARALLAVAIVAALAGCGGGDGSTGTSAQGPAVGAPDAGSAAPGPAVGASSRKLESELPPEARVDLAIKGVLASAAPELACRRYATLRYVEKTFGSRSGCVQSTVPASAADAVKVTRIEISGAEATARAVPSGGPSDGETIKVELVRQGRIWKVASLRSNAPVGP